MSLPSEEGWPKGHDSSPSCNSPGFSLPSSSSLWGAISAWVCHVGLAPPSFPTENAGCWVCLLSACSLLPQDRALQSLAPQQTLLNMTLLTLSSLLELTLASQCPPSTVISRSSISSFGIAQSWHSYPFPAPPSVPVLPDPPLPGALWTSPFCISSSPYRSPWGVLYPQADSVHPNNWSVFP